MNKNIVIFYVPGAMGSFVSWMLERFNTLRTDVIDNPLTNNGSSHGYASLCSVESIDSVYRFLDDTNFPSWGYKIWAGWPVDKSNSIDHCIQQTLIKMKPQDRPKITFNDKKRTLRIGSNKIVINGEKDYDTVKMLLESYSK